MLNLGKMVILNRHEFRAYSEALEMQQRVFELARWLNPWREMYGSLFSHLIHGKNSVECAREEILEDYIKVGNGTDGHRIFVNKGR